MGELNSNLSTIDQGLIRLYAAACLYDYSSLHKHASYVYDEGGTVDQVRATVRHLVVFAGYGPCLAAMTALKKHGSIPYNTPGKIAGYEQGNAFALVYKGIDDQVRRKVYDADPVLEQWIQHHLYGDVYSSPGISLLQKQYLTLVGLVKSNMVEQVYGHAIAALRFGATEHCLKDIVDIVCSLMPPKNDLENHRDRFKRTIDMAVIKFNKSFHVSSPCDTDENVTCCNNPSSICIPDITL